MAALSPDLSTVASRLLGDLLARIQDGRWGVGTVLPGERVLMAEFSVSRVALREALAALRALGVLDTAHGRRSRVRPLGAEVLAWLLPLVLPADDPHAARHMLEVRLALEPQVAGLAARHFSAADEARLAAAVQGTADHAAAGGPAFVAADLAFHHALAESCGNPLLHALVTALGGIYAGFVRENAADSLAVRRQAALDHAAILAAVRSRDSQRATAQMQQHLLATASRRAKQDASPAE